MTDLSRRGFLIQSGSCAAHLALAGLTLPPVFRARWARQPLGRIVAQEKFARLEQIGPGVWAVISTPLNGDYTTVANGGLVAGKSGVLAIEGFMQPAGAGWLATKARELTGRWPTHVVVTHYHGDHSNGVAGYRAGGSAIALHATGVTGTLVRDRNQPADSDRTAVFAGAIPVATERESTIDLGDRAVRLVARSGHTASDVTIELDEPSIVFAGDLVWNAMFPNYVDAVPSLLGRTVAALARSPETIYVPGHGALSRAAEFVRYREMLDEVERAAREAHGKGVPAAEAASGYRLPAGLGEWHLFSPAFMERAFAAWYKELGG